jgi:hypothetical protein
MADIIPFQKKIVLDKTFQLGTRRDLLRRRIYEVFLAPVEQAEHRPGSLSEPMR